MESELRVPALKAQARRMVEDWEGPQRGSKPAMIAVLKDLLAALAAAEAERDEARAERDDADHVRRLVQQRNAALRQHATSQAAALTQISLGVDHPRGLHAVPEFYEGVQWAQAVARAALAAPAEDPTDGNESAVPRGHGIRVYIRITDPESGLDYTLACGHGSTHHHIAAAAVEITTGVEKVCQMALAHREQTGCVCAADEEASRGD
jgi:hypothetical protein